MFCALHGVGDFDCEIIVEPFGPWKPRRGQGGWMGVAVLAYTNSSEHSWNKKNYDEKKKKTIIKKRKQ